MVSSTHVISNDEIIPCGKALKCHLVVLLQTFKFNYTISGEGSIFNVIITSFMENLPDVRTENRFTVITAEHLQTNMVKKRYICYLDKKAATSTSRFLPPQLSHKARNQISFLKHYLQQRKEKEKKLHLPHTP